ncbi:MAG: DUF1552 domain-containing protein [Planctomycetota bacterium]
MMHARIDRRRLLRGAGAALALPWLEKFTRPRAKAPVRMAFVFVPNGMLPSAWECKGNGEDFAWSPTLEPLAPLRARTTVLSGLWNASADDGEGHYVKTTSLLSGAKVRRTGGSDLYCGTTIDQFAAARVGHRTALPSLELGIERTRHVVDMGYSTVYGATISWRAPDRPMPKEIAPRQAFARLFRGGRRGRNGEDSVLDLVAAEARALRTDLGREDGERLEDYLAAIRQLELRIDRFDRERERAWEDLPADAYAERAPHDHREHVDLMLGLIELAFRTDTTRIATIMLGNSVSGVDFSFLDGVRGGHHELSHHERDAAKAAQYARINRWFVERFADMGARMAATKEGDSDLLESSMLFFGSGIRDGNAHDPHDLPIVLLGGGGGRLRGGQRVRSRRDTPLTNLYVTMLDVFGCPVERFSDSTGRLDAILTG